MCPFSLGLGAPPASFCCPVRGAALHGKFSVASDTPMTCTLPFLLPWQELLLTSVYSLVSSWWAEFGVSMCLTHLSQPPSQRHLPLKDVLRRIMRSRPSIVVTGSLSLSQVWWEGRDAGGSIVTWRSAPSPLAVGDGRAGSSASGRLALLPPPTRRLAQAFSRAAASVLLSSRGSVSATPLCLPKPTTCAGVETLFFPSPVRRHPGRRG